MQFAAPLPWWLAVLVAAAVAAVAWLSYSRLPVPLSAARRSLLVALRAVTLSALVIVLCRPAVLVPPPAADVVVPVLVDVSRSMGVADVDGQTRAAHAARLVADLWPALSERFQPELFGVGEGLTPLTADRLHADDRQSNLAAGLQGIRARLRGRSMPGIILISDGAATASDADASSGAEGPPVLAVGVGSTTLVDREVVSAVAGDPRLDQASVDLQVTAVSRGFGREPFELRLAANGVVVDSRTVTPADDGSPVVELFTVTPDPVAGTVYTASVPPADGEMVAGNNASSTLVSPAGRPRRMLALFGAPGYDHSFLLRALSRDSGLDVDTIVRKGRDETGRDTFLIQAAASRAPSLAGGFPETREALYEYDGLLLANVEGDSLTRAQLALIADFVATRGGGLVVFGARSLSSRGFIGTALEDVLPVELDERRGGLRRDSVDAESAGPQHAVGLTPEGTRHAIMRLGASPAESSRRWSLVPPLASVTMLGAPRPGATVLAVSTTPNGAVAPLVAVQRYGRGRSLVFAGEASWHWRMLLPAADRTYESFWRQSARWVSAPAPDRITIETPDSPEAGDRVQVRFDIRDRSFEPAAGANVTATLTAPDGQTTLLDVRADAGAAGRAIAEFRPGAPGLHRIAVEANAGGTQIGSADQWLLVGGADRELADPRLNAAYLQRLARLSGGRYLDADEARSIPELLGEVAASEAPPVFQDLWQRPWVFLLIVGLLAAEWSLRRRWGLR